MRQLLWQVVSVGTQPCKQLPRAKQSGSLEQTFAGAQQLAVTQLSHWAAEKTNCPQLVPASTNPHGIAQLVCRQET